MTVPSTPPIAPQPPTPPIPRLRYLVAGGLCLGAVAFLLFGGLSKNIVYFRTTSEAVKTRSEQGTHRFRLMGAVVNSSQSPTNDGVSFEVTDGVERVKVVHHGSPPELFKDGVPVVCEGRWEAGSNGDWVFDSDRIMIKHGSEYRPPAVDSSK
jgi:cytochrome c-type biogenesis protein CcmE